MRQHQTLGDYGDVGVAKSLVRMQSSVGGVRTTVQLSRSHNFEEP